MKSRLLARSCNTRDMLSHTSYKWLVRGLQCGAQTVGPRLEWPARDSLPLWPSVRLGAPPQSGLGSIVVQWFCRFALDVQHPTAQLKPLSGQIDRVRRGKSYLVFGTGRLTACKPISARDLGVYLAECLDGACRWNRVVPIGGPGPAITPLAQAKRLFELLGETPRVRRVPVALLDAITMVLIVLGTVSLRLRDKAELARIGRYYATESMLVFDEARGHFDADATPSTGADTLFDFYAKVVAEDAKVDLGDHAVF